MNTSKLKSYAPAARRDFIRAVTERAAKVGVTSSSAAPVEVRGDVALIAGQAFPRQAAEQRKALDLLIQRRGFSAVMEEAAYTWFNRFMAIRYMEVHGYLSHGYRVLSNVSGSQVPEIMDHAENEHVSLPGVSRKRIVALKLDGTRDEELYKLLILGQCRALHNAMPFLFEPIGDVTELLLPDLLLATDSVIRKMVTEIDEADWERIEVVGWLYQFYISEKKDEVIGKVVMSEDIPAATQLFTPNWIVKYMTQNSLGRMWLATYPNSALKAKMEYYIEPAEQTEEVQAQLEAITPKALDPETITLMDPACGSGHILVEAYDLFKEIYLERGYRLRDIPRLILTKNLYGLEIDDRAAQMSGFALLMKARADDRGILSNPPKLNVLALQSSEGMNAAEIAAALLKEEVVPIVPSLEMFAETKPQPVLMERRLRSVTEKDIAALIDLFANAKTFGSLITVPPSVASKITELIAIGHGASEAGNVLMHQYGHELARLSRQAEMLATKYDVTLANPPYMGNRYLTPILKHYLKIHFDDFEKDLFSAFIIRNLKFTKTNGELGFMSPFVWMFISSYEKLRNKLIDEHTISTLVQLEYSGFDGATVPVCAFTVTYRLKPRFLSSFIRLSDHRGADIQGIKTLEAIRDKNCGWFYKAEPHQFDKIPGSPIAYWVSDKVRQSFEDSDSLEKIAPCRQGLATTDNKQYLRLWWETDVQTIGFSLKSRDAALTSKLRWFPYNKGGSYRRWYGNAEWVVDWQNDGERIRHSVITKYPYLNGNDGFVVKNTDYYFRSSITWTFISSAYFAVRYCEDGFIFDVAGSSAFPKSGWHNLVLGFLASSVATLFLQAMNPTLNFQVGNISQLPLDESRVQLIRANIDDLVASCINHARNDWNAFETSWDFERPPYLGPSTNLQSTYGTYERDLSFRRSEMRRLESENNRLWIEAYGLLDELSPNVTDDQITLAHADRDQDMRRLISFAIGCLMGRYSLDEPGLIYAHSGGEVFDASRYNSIPADDDGILPVTETDWFEVEDTANRFSNFVAAGWPRETLDENLKFVADSLTPKADEDPLATIRRYFATGFYKDHLQTYKRRPIYWLFSSGKERAFQALVYLHRYNEGTLARMRTEYVLPLMSRMTARIEQLSADIDASPSAAERRRRQSEYDKLRKQAVELQSFDEKLRHYSDRRLHLDLDDGVRLNYGKFSDPKVGDILADVKAITGGSDD